ncbi:MAG: glycosyltransferase family 2 protein [Terriglobia bacterium]
MVLRNGEQPELSFVLVNYKVGRELAECVQSLQQVQNDLACEFIVVDNSPPDASTLLADRGLGNLRVLSNPQNVGYAAACNLGARACRAPYIWFLNPDVRYVRGSVTGLLGWLDRNPWAALAGPRVLNPDGTRQFSCRSFPSWTTSFSHRYSALTRAFPANPLSQGYLRMNLDGKPTEVDWASGCCLLVRRAIFEELGGFDEGYFLFFEDVDLAHRLKRRGGQCAYYPQVEFTHAIGSSRAFLPDQGIRAKHLGAARYFTKNVIRNPWLARAFRWAVSLRCRIAEQVHRYRLWRSASPVVTRVPLPRPPQFNPVPLKPHE